MGDIKSYFAKDDEKYFDNWVARINSKSKEVISFGKNLGDVVREANSKGITNPCITYVQDPDKIQEYVVRD